MVAFALSPGNGDRMKKSVTRKCARIKVNTYAGWDSSIILDLADQDLRSLVMAEDYLSASRRVKSPPAFSSEHEEGPTGGASW